MANVNESKAKKQFSSKMGKGLLKRPDFLIYFYWFSCTLYFLKVYFVSFKF